MQFVPFCFLYGRFSSIITIYQPMVTQNEMVGLYCRDYSLNDLALSGLSLLLEQNTENRWQALG